MTRKEIWFYGFVGGALGQLSIIYLIGKPPIEALSTLFDAMYWSGFALASHYWFNRGASNLAANSQ